MGDDQWNNRILTGLFSFSAYNWLQIWLMDDITLGLSEL